MKKVCILVKFNNVQCSKAVFPGWHITMTVWSQFLKTQVKYIWINSYFTVWCSQAYTVLSTTLPLVWEIFQNIFNVQISLGTIKKKKKKMWKTIGKNLFELCSFYVYNSKPSSENILRSLEKAANSHCFHRHQSINAFSKKEANRPGC